MRLALQSLGICLFVLYLGVTGYHSFNVPEDVREDDWSLNPEGMR